MSTPGKSKVHIPSFWENLTQARRRIRAVTHLVESIADSILVFKGEWTGQADDITDVAQAVSTVTTPRPGVG